MYTSEHLSRDALRRRWKYLREHERSCNKQRQEKILYVTDFVTVHALRWDRLVIGDLGVEERAAAPDYYFDREDRQVAVWFRVRDLRLVASSQMESLAYFQESLGRVLGPETPEFSDFFSPYASQATPYPLIIEGSAAKSIFSYPQGVTGLGEGMLYADDDTYVFPSAVRRALATLEGKIRDIWEDLNQNAKLYLASAAVVTEQGADDPLFDYTGAAACAAKAVEAEIVRDLIPLILAKSQDLGDEKKTGEPGRQDTLGQALHRMDGLLASLTGDAGECVKQLVVGGAWRRWMGAFVRWRGRKLHAEPVNRSEITKTWEDLFGNDYGLTCRR
jgi:hypothetical protein